MRKSCVWGDGMELREVLDRFPGKREGAGNRYKCMCPVHKDRNPSLGITEKDGKILINCFAGCDTANVLAAVGLGFSDLYNDEFHQKTWQEKVERSKGEQITAVYNYTDQNGKYLYTKFRTPTVKGCYGIVNEDGTYFKYGLNGIDKTLYNLPEAVKAIKAGSPVYFVEGEKDVETLTRLGLPATTCGGANEWKAIFSGTFTNATVVILPDNDEAGRKLADQVVTDLTGVAKEIVVVPTSRAEKGDVTDYLNEGHTKEDLLKLVDAAMKAAERTDPLSMLTVNEIEEKQVDWLVMDYIPKGQITILGGEGGSGKTSTWCAIAAAISSGNPCFMVKDLMPEGFITEEPRKVMFFSAEDSVEHVLKARLRSNGANQENLLTIDISDDRFENIRFNSKFLEDLIKEYRPALVIFDPIQAFVPPEIKMSERNAMRNCLRPLIGFGEKYSCSFLIVVHTNKQNGLWGRKRLADSADIWDIARSVFLIGETKEKNIRYISHEKCNYGMTAKTVLFSNASGRVEFKGYTDKKDKEFITEMNFATKAAPQREEAKEFILDTLKEQDGEMLVAELNEIMEVIGIREKTLERAKSDLKKSGKIDFYSVGKGHDKKHYIVAK